MAKTTPAQPTTSAATTPAPKKSKLWLWIILIVLFVLTLGGVGVGFIIWGVIQTVQTGGDVNINSGTDLNTNTTDVDLGWLSNSDLIGNADQGFSLLVPDDWTLVSDDPIENGSVKNYTFIYEDDVNGKTTNHFEFQEQAIVDGSDVTLAQYSSDFIASLNEGLADGDFKLLKTDNRTVGLKKYPGYVAVIGDDKTGGRNYYLLTVVDNVEYEFAVFYFSDQEDQALADFDKVVLTFEVK